jgi:hypothetical protein
MPSNLHFNKLRGKIWNPKLTLYGPLVIISTTYFNTQNLCILPTRCICEFRTLLTIDRDFSGTALNDLALQRTRIVSREVRTGFPYIM